MGLMTDYDERSSGKDMSIFQNQNHMGLDEIGNDKLLTNRESQTNNNSANDASRNNLVPNKHQTTQIAQDTYFPATRCIPEVRKLGNHDTNEYVLISLVFSYPPVTQ